MVSSVSSTNLEDIKQLLQRDSDSATLSDTQFEAAYQYFRTNCDVHTASPGDLQEIFWLYVCLNETDDLKR